MTSQTQIGDQQVGLVDAIIANVLQPNNHELLRHLGQVLGIDQGSRVLLIVESGKQAHDEVRAALAGEIEVYNGELRPLPYEAGAFDSVVVAVPIHAHLHAVARELWRVLKPNGSLGMVVFSVYRDQMPDDAALFEQVMPLMATARPAAAYRAVLAESGFTAFVSEDRRRDLRRTARDNYRHLLVNHGGEGAPQVDPASQALTLMATGGVGLTLITAEKSV
jgi:SAM-dependent methyltransferase